MTADFCVEAGNEVIIKYDKPDIFNTDQGSQFASAVFTGQRQEKRQPDQHGSRGLLGR